VSSANTFLLFGALLLFASVLASVLSSRLGFPLLLVFLVAGMLAGEDGPGRVPFDDFEAAFLVGQLALAVILLDGGLRTGIRTFRVALGPALALATGGVALTAGLLGAFAAVALGFDWRYGLLLGAITGSTDAAAVFALLRHSGVAL
jgi:cell volume regulation protein A